MGPETTPGPDRDEPAAGEVRVSPRDAEEASQISSLPGVRLASVVMFVHDLDVSVAFYRALLGMEVTVRSPTAALLVSVDDFQLYLRAMGPGATRALGAAGVQYVIWTATDEEDLRRCEALLRDASAHVHTQTGDGFTLVEGRDPNGVPVMVTYPGPDLAVRHRIMARIYAW